MLFDPERTSFLRPSSLLYELIVLKEIEKNGFVAAPRTSFRELAATLVQASITRFQELGWIRPAIEDGQSVYRLTPDGVQRVRLLMVDYIRELNSLNGAAVAIFRKRLATFYMEGVRRVAFYPLGETAEVVYRALQDTGLTLVAAIDDDASRWDSEFHTIRIQGPRAITEKKIDAVIVTTCAFQVDVIRSIEALRLPGLTILAL